MRRSVVALLLVSLGAGCASHRAPSTRDAVPDFGESLEAFMTKMRVLPTEAKPRTLMQGLTIETTDPALRDALAALASRETGERHRRVAMEYRRLGVLDMAHAHFTSAIRLNPHDAIAHDALARIWRAWGLPLLGLTNAYHAVYFAPKSAAAATTLASLLEDTDLAAAQRWFDRALALDPGAAYALNNVCYVSLRARRADAIAACTRAYEAAPDSPVFRNNLALAYAAAGELSRARALFEAGGDRDTAAYNMGVVFMARGEYRLAVEAFHDALHENPRFAEAAVRAGQAHEMVARQSRR